MVNFLSAFSPYYNLSIILYLYFLLSTTLLLSGGVCQNTDIDYSFRNSSQRGVVVWDLLFSNYLP